MATADRTTKAVAQGQALVRAIEAMGTIKPSGLFERATAGLLLPGYKRRLKAVIGLVPAWAGKKILGASQHNQRPAGGKGWASQQRDRHVS